MDDPRLARLDELLADLPCPASKDEVVAQLDQAGADDDLLWLVNAAPGVFFMYASDVTSTARIALEEDIATPLPGGAPVPPAASDAQRADLLREQLALSPDTDAHLIRVEVRDGIVSFDGRTPDVRGGVMAARIALAVMPGCRVVNRLDVQG
jgi:hypothetical protein